MQVEAECVARQRNVGAQLVALAESAVDVSRAGDSMYPVHAHDVDDMLHDML